MSDKRSNAILIVSLVFLLISIGSFLYQFTVEKAAAEASEMMRARFLVFGEMGRLDIDEVDIHIPLYAATAEKTPQDVVDDAFSGWYAQWPTMEVVADHVSSGNMRRLKGIANGTRAAIVAKDEAPRVFQCFLVEPGCVADGCLRTVQGVCVRNNPYGADLIVYTCDLEQDPNAEVCKVTVTYWLRSQNLNTNQPETEKGD